MGWREQGRGGKVVDTGGDTEGTNVVSPYEVGDVLIQRHVIKR